MQSIRFIVPAFAYSETKFTGKRPFFFFFCKVFFSPEPGGYLAEIKTEYQIKYQTIPKPDVRKDLKREILKVYFRIFMTFERPFLALRSKFSVFPKKVCDTTADTNKFIWLFL